MTSLPNEWYEDVSPGVRRLHPPGIDFEWIDIILQDDSVEDAKLWLGRMRYPPEIILEAIDLRGGSLGYRHRGTSLLRLEIPRGVLVDSNDNYMISILQDKEKLVTIRRRSMGIVEDACSGIADQDSESVTMLAVTAEIGDEFMDRVVPSIRRIADELDALESEMDERRSDRVDRVAYIRRLLLGIDRHVEPLQSAIQRSLLDVTSRNDPSATEALKGLQDRASWFEHRIQIQLDRARILTDREHILTMDDMSTSMYRLSWIATIFLPLTFITGLLGINVGGIPFAGAASGFWLVCGALALIALITTISLGLALRFGKRKRDDRQDRFRRSELGSGPRERST